MWPGDQHGGENPQQPNPYQQPGYQQPNPYQQPGAQQPAYGYPPQGPGQGAYPGQQQWGPPGMPGGPQPPQGGGNSSRTTAIAIIAAVAVIAAAAVTGVLLLKDDGENDTASGGEASTKPTQQSARPSPTKSEKDASDPVVPGWQAVINPKHYSAFDVPEGDDWEIASQGTITGFADDDKPEEVLVAMSAPAYYKQDWCKDSSRAIVGTKGGQGSKSTQEGAEIAAANWALAGYDQDQKGTLKESGAKPFKNKHGIKGHVATASLTGAPAKGACGVSDAEVVAISWINANDDLAIWVFLQDAGVKDELPDATVKKMMGSLRDYGEPGEGSDPRG